jgi:AmmeMemoRadiSam system protein A
MKYTKDEKNTLLNIAEWAIQDHLTTGKRRSLPDTFHVGGQLSERVGAFVSVYVNKKLRGCIGTFSETAPLHENVRQMAIQAATEDHRFKPLQPKDIDRLHVEISVLSKRWRINGPEEIEIGKHGIYLINGFRRATLLPQVAVTHKLSPVEFLECCAENKLGLSKDSWKESELYVYEAVVID